MALGDNKASSTTRFITGGLKLRPTTAVHYGQSDCWAILWHVSSRALCPAQASVTSAVLSHRGSRALGAQAEQRVLSHCFDIIVAAC